jgi:amino acid adenylation domain-containing protein
MPSHLPEVRLLKTIPTTPSQMEIWLQCYLAGKEASMAYNESYAVNLFGELKASCLEEALRIVISKYEGMRAVFSHDGSQIIILKSIESPFRFHDISSYSEEEKNKFVENHSIETGFYEFNLEKGPLFIFELIKLSDSEHRLTMTAHHIVFDGWSMVLFYSQLGFVYGQLVEEKEVFLPVINELSDFSLKIHEFSESEQSRLNRDFWGEKLSNPIPRFDLPIDFERPPIRNFRSERLEYKASADLILKAKRFGVKHKISLHLLLQSIFELFLSQWSKSEDVIFGMPRAGQPVMKSTNMIGHCTFLLPIRAIINPDLTFEEYLIKRNEAFAEVLEHGIISFGELIQNLKIKRDLSRIPLLPVTFNISVGQERRIKFKGLEKLFEPNPKAFGNFEILIDLFGSIDNVTYEWTYNVSLFSEDTILAAAEKYDQLIQLLIEEPSLKLSSIKSLFAEVDLSKLCVEEKPAPNEEVTAGEKTIAFVIEKFQESASVFPEKTAVVTNDNSIAYKELNNRSNQLAGLLKDKGVQPGDFVGVYLERSNATIISILAILKAGGAYLPIDVEIPKERAIYMLENSGAKFYFTDQPSFDNEVLEDKRLVFNKVLKDSIEYSFENNPVKTTLESPMYIIYTSGSTGNPKGVTLTHRNLNYFSKEAIRDLNFSSDDLVAGVTSVSFDVATLELLIPYMFGATVYMLDKYERKDPKQILSFLEAKGITKMFATPTHWQMMVNSGWSTPMTSLSVLSAGEPLKKSLVDQLSPLSNEIFNLYGPSETTVFSTLKKVDSSEKQITIGKEVPGTKIYFVDKSGNLIDKPNISGEIWIGGDSVGKSYLGLEELSEEKFIRNPFEEIPERLYKTGDLGFRLPNGEIQCEGRIDHQVKIRGHRIELGEIEQRILTSDKISNVVVGTDDSQGFTSLIGYISLKDDLDDSFDSQEFVENLREELLVGLPEYMVPSKFYIVDDFELTTSGKIDRKQLSKIKTGNSELSNTYSSAELQIEEFSNVEQRVYDLWSKVLGDIKLDLDSNFFIVGGHSLLGVKLISLLEKEFTITLSLITLFQYPTVRSISRLIASKIKDSTSDSLVLIKKGSPHKVLCFVHAVGLNPIEVNMLVENMDEDQTIYGLQSPAISGNSKAFETIPEMAGHFITELDKSGIKEPYNLMGNSIGGLIVFEMAKQLIASNRRLGFIGMIDTVAQFYNNNPNNFSSGLERSMKKLGFELQFLFDDLPYYLQYRKKYFEEKWSNYKGNPKEDNDLLSRIREIELVNIEAWKCYKMEPLDIDITLFLAQRRTFFVEDFETLGWDNYTRSVEKFVMPGEHANMLKPPYGSEFTKVLQEKLNHFILR